MVNYEKLKSHKIIFKLEYNFFNYNLSSGQKRCKVIEAIEGKISEYNIKIFSNSNSKLKYNKDEFFYKLWGPKNV